MTTGNPDRKTASSDIHNPLPHSAVRDELDRILTNPEFLASEKRRKFLSFVVDETLAGNADQLKGYTIARMVFGRGKDFDPANDPVVRIQAGKLRRELERYYLIAGGDDPIRVNIPKGRYVPFFVKQPAVGAESASPAPEESLVLSTPSVAVMSLANLTNDPDQTYFLDGLHSELTMELGRYQDIIAIPCNHGAPLAELPTDVQKLAATLGARFLLGGTLRKDEKTAKVTLQLTDAATGRQVWSHAYSHGWETNGMIATQEQIARDVVATIAGELGIISQRLSRESRKKSPAELTTYEAMLRYHHYMRVMSADSYQDAFTTLRFAVGNEPEYGPAWSALANLYCHSHVRDVPGLEAPLEKATEFARKGVVFEPGNQLTRTIMAYVHLLRGDHDSVQEEVNIALGLNPNSLYYLGTLGYVLVFSGEFRRGRELLDKVIAMNPCHPRWFHHACWLDKYQQGDYTESYREATLAGPVVDYWNQVLCIASLGQLGRKPEAKAYVGELRRIKPDFESRARELIDRVLKLDDVVERVVEGLRAAGLVID
jgi:adenylate cyclase